MTDGIGNGTVESGYQVHALIGIIVKKRYALQNKECQILGVEG